jgi:hypothetical protein
MALAVWSGGPKPDSSWSRGAGRGDSGAPPCTSQPDSSSSSPAPGTPPPTSSQNDRKAPRTPRAASTTLGHESQQRAIVRPDDVQADTQRTDLRSLPGVASSLDGAVSSRTTSMKAATGGIRGPARPAQHGPYDAPPGMTTRAAALGLSAAPAAGSRPSASYGTGESIGFPGSLARVRVSGPLVRFRCIFLSARRCLPLTVPSGAPTFSAISVWVSPLK